MNTKEKIFLISLGCAKNLVDSEYMLGLLKSEGFDLCTTIEGAGIAVINTCGFIQAAVRETVDTIFEVVNLKKQGKLKKIAVVGCFVQRYGYKLRREIPEVDGWLGTGEIYRIAELLQDNSLYGQAPFFIGRPTYLPSDIMPRVQTTPFYSAYLKIAEGCSRKCSYCTIPSLTGPFRSRSPESLINEVKEMIDHGVKEINLVAQDVSLYGKDLEEDITVEDLLERLVLINGIKWIRLLYCHPDGVSDRLLALIECEKSICPYLDVPIQHINKNILKAMGRNSDGWDPWGLIERIRSGRRRISIRTSLMVGFPGETEVIFDELRDFVKTACFDILGVFVYSREKGTPAARLESMVECKVAKGRKDEIMTIQADISKSNNQRIVGRIVPVLIEGPSPETNLLLRGRTSRMAPDVDGQVLINKGDGVVGEIMPALINEAYAYDLVGEIRNELTSDDLDFTGYNGTA